MDNRHFILEKIAGSTGLCVRGFTRGTHVERFRFGLPFHNDPLNSSIALSKALHDICADSQVPVVQPDHPGIAYGVFATDEWVLILGPANTGELDQWQLDEYAMGYNIPPESLNIPPLRPHTFTDAVLLCLAVMDKVDEIVEWRLPLIADYAIEEAEMAFQLTVLETAEQGVERLGYAEEREILGLVSHGDPDALQKHRISHMLNQMGYFCDNAFKQREYTACMLIALAARGALVGGVTPHLALSLQDMGMRRLSKCRTIAEIDILCSQTIHGLAGIVKNHQTKRTSVSYIEKVKQYISTHLSTPFSLEQVANEIGISQQYLSRRFREVEGVGFKQYSQAQRLQAAANMLRFTSTPITTIASYFCYPSQSHFCKMFRQHFGTTPQKYRNSKQ